MQYREHRPSLPLKSAVACYWTLLADGAATHRVLPDGSLDVLFSFADPVTSRDAAIVGAMTHAVVVEPSGRVDLLGVRFRPGEAARLLGLPVAELTDDATELHAAWGAASRSLHGELGDSPTPEGRLRALDRALLHRLDRAAAPDPGMRAAVALARGTNGRSALVELARAAGLTPRTLERRFERAVGLGPKTFSRVMRLQALVAAVLAAPGRPDWAALAADFGFYDQAHFIHDFRALAGLTPSEYVRELSGGASDRAAPVFPSS